jgi:hypothetical protein
MKSEWTFHLIISFEKVYEHSQWPHVKLTALDIYGWFLKIAITAAEQYNLCAELSWNKDWNFWLTWMQPHRIIWSHTSFGIVQLFLPWGIHIVISSIIETQTTSDALCPFSHKFPVKSVWPHVISYVAKTFDACLCFPFSWQFSVNIV